MEAFLVERPFAPYGTSHVVVLALLALAGVVLVVWGRRHRDTTAGLRLSRALAVLILLLQVPLQIMSMIPPYWNIAASLPLQLCDLAWMVTAYALWTHRPWAYALTYYWALTLTVQALITPALEFDFPHVSFFMFWGGHGLSVLAAIFLTWGSGLRPNWSSYRITVVLTLAWMAFTFAFNSVAGTNYGFLNGKPPVKSILDLLGAWPWYLATEIALCAVVWSLMTWPWVARAETGARRSMTA